MARSDYKTKAVDGQIVNLTEDEIDDCVASEKAAAADFAANGYKDRRLNSYPDLKEQFDMLYHDMTAGKGTKDGEWYKAIKAVKDANVKPG